jgi:DeoR/GlpR family transcriptional regulator of sugar metabolism
MNTIQAEPSNSEQYLKDERLAQIRHLVELNGQMTVPELSSRFNVSEATIRRDLEELDGHWLRRTHGGAVRLERAAKEPPILQRVSEQQTEKARIGQAAARLIQNGETIFLGSGSTVLEIAHAIPTEMHLTVITNSIAVVNQLAAHPQVELVVIGGQFRPSELSMVGHIAEQDIREFRTDRAFLGMRGIDLKQGFTNDFLPETMTDRTILSIAPQVVIVADHTKFNRVSMVFVAHITAAHCIITDAGTPAEQIAEIKELGVEVIVA